MQRILIFACAWLVLAGGSALADDGATAPSGDLVENGQKVVTRGENLSRRVTRMLSEARRAKDIIRVTCLSNKLTQINALLGNARQRLDGLKSSADPGQRTHEATVLSVLDQKFQVLDQEAAQCVGQSMFETGTTKVETKIDPRFVPFQDIPADNPPSGAPPTVASGGVDQNVVLAPAFSGV